jgi:hypothetical protein
VSGERAARRHRDRGERGGKKVGVPGVAVPLIGGAGLSAGTVESAVARGPAREESGVAEPR